MKKLIYTLKVYLTAILILTSAVSDIHAQQLTDKGLKDYYKNYFPIGVAVSPQALNGPEAELIVKHFNSITPENAMKMGPIHPEENRYDWDDADRIVSFAQQHGIKLRGHALCWHEQTPSWIFTDAKGDTVTKEVLLKRLHDHITTVVSRYKGKVYAWDVVNEAVADEPSRFLRNSPWYKICGVDFIIKAFEYAHAADPEAKLFYNDYNTEHPEKRDRIYTLLKKLVDANVPVHGIGLQGHWSIFEPTETELRATLDKFSSLKLNIQITELDMSIYKWEKFKRDRRQGERDVFTSELENRQMEQYKMIFKVFRDYKNVISGITFWNISDKRSWLDAYPVEGRKNYPLLFDQKLNPKKAYYEVITF